MWGRCDTVFPARPPPPNNIPIIVFSGSATLKNIESSIPVIYDNKLNSTIRNYCVEKCINSSDLITIQYKLESAKITEKTARKEHVKNIKQNIFEKKKK